MTRPDWVRNLEAFAGRILLEEQTPGTAVGFSVDGEPLYQAGFGWRDREKGLPVTPDTFYGIASVTKSFTGVAIMQLQERGKLSVHDPVLRYLPEFRTPNPEYTAQMTIHHFLTHTAGIPPLQALYALMRDYMLADPYVRELPFYPQVQALPSLRSSEEYMAYLAEQAYPLLGPPGTRFSYCNDTYNLLGTIIERISGKDFNQYVTDEILIPAGMTRSAFRAEDLPSDDEVAQLYANYPSGEIKPAPGWWNPHFPAAGAAGKLKSTVPDLLRYMEIYRTGGMVGDARILRPESVEAMTTPHFPLGPNEGYGYGLMITRDYHGCTVVQHGGTLKGIKTNVFCVPERGLTGAMLANVDSAPMSRLTWGAVNAYLGLPAESPVLNLTESPADPESLREYEGEFLMGEPPLLMEVTGEGLEAVAGKKRYPLRHVRRDLFIMKFAGTDETVQFLRNASGEIDAVFFHLRTVPRKGS